MIERAQADFDLKAEIINEAQELASTGIRVAKIPSLTYDVLRNLAKGRMKVNLELTGYDTITERIAYTVQSVLIAAFACVMFLGGCLLCGTDMVPRIHGMPAAALLCFVVAVSLSIFSVRRMRRMP
jgi:ubiquinone biosynthesis protein